MVPGRNFLAGFSNNSTILYTMVWEFPSREMGVSRPGNGSSPAGKWEFLYIFDYNCIQLKNIVQNVWEFPSREMGVSRPGNVILL